MKPAPFEQVRSKVFVGCGFGVVGCHNKSIVLRNEGLHMLLDVAPDSGLVGKQLADTIKLSVKVSQ